MAIPKALIEFSIWSILDESKDTQLVLLKGHLILEVILSSVIGTNDFSFFRKTKEFAKICKSEFVIESLMKINDIRNELAHEWQFKVDESGIAQWASDVLGNIEYQQKFRHTFRMKIVHAFAALAGEIYSYETESKDDKTRVCIT